LDRQSADAKTIAREAELSYEVVLHHLRLLGAERMVERKGTRPYMWMLTGLGQKRLVN